MKPRPEIKLHFRVLSEKQNTFLFKEIQRSFLFVKVVMVIPKEIKNPEEPEKEYS